MILGFFCTRVILHYLAIMFFITTWMEGGLATFLAGMEASLAKSTASLAQLTASLTRSAASLAKVVTLLQYFLQQAL
jgi:hypothetical protein